MRELIISKIQQQHDDMASDHCDMFEGSTIESMEEVLVMTDEDLLNFYEYLVSFQG